MGRTPLPQSLTTTHPLTHSLPTHQHHHHHLFTACLSASPTRPPSTARGSEAQTPYNFRRIASLFHLSPIPKKCKTELLMKSTLPLGQVNITVLN